MMNKDNPIDAYIFDKWEKELQGAVVLNNCERSLTKAAFLFVLAGIASILQQKVHIVCALMARKHLCMKCYLIKN